MYLKCKELSQNGFRIICPSVDEQDSYLSKLGNIINIIPYNSDNRRNIGFLMAIEKGCDILISIDDDNFCYNGDNKIYSQYAIVCEDYIEQEVVSSSNGWFNPCDILELEHGQKIYMRGFPYKYRENISYTFSKEKCIVRINMGLWYEDPDVDAITWLAIPSQVKSFSGKSITLSRNTWSNKHPKYIPASRCDTGLLFHSYGIFYKWIEDR